MFDRTVALEHLRRVTWQVIDQDPDLEQELRAHYFFWYTIMQQGPNAEREVTGCHFSQRGLNTLLVVKSVLGDIPQVAFVTEKFPTGCVVTFGRLWLEERVTWHLDKFA